MTTLIHGSVYDSLSIIMTPSYLISVHYRIPYHTCDLYTGIYRYTGMNTYVYAYVYADAVCELLVSDPG